MMCLFAVVNIGLGIYLIEQTQASYSGLRALYVYIVFLIVTVLLQVTMFIWYTYKAKTAPEEGSTVGDMKLPRIVFPHCSFSE